MPARLNLYSVVHITIRFIITNVNEDSRYKLIDLSDNLKAKGSRNYLKERLNI